MNDSGQPRGVEFGPFACVAAAWEAHHAELYGYLVQPPGRRAAVLLLRHAQGAAAAHAVVFVMGMVNSYFTPERTRALLAGRAEGVANVMAASLGIVTPFCSCSAVPLFIGFVQAGVPLGVTFSFLISAPMVNEVALALLFGLFGWKIALLYLGLGLSVAIVAGWVIGRLKMEAPSGGLGARHAQGQAAAGATG
jgi:uncharacterized membrane protein YraQ (UPF0718 family)